MNKVKRVVMLIAIMLLSANAARAAKTDCYHICDSICQDRIEQYENQIGGCANGGPLTGPVPGYCEFNFGPPLQLRELSFFCENGGGCIVSGRLNCGAGKYPAVPNVPQTQSNGLICPEKNHPSGVLLPAVVLHENNGACEYVDGTFIAFQCDSAGTGVDVFYGQHYGSGPFPAWP